MILTSVITIQKTRSGKAFHADYGLGWGFGNGWVAGIGGYAFMQTTNDSRSNSAQGKARAYSIGIHSLCQPSRLVIYG